LGSHGDASHFSGEIKPKGPEKPTQSRTSKHSSNMRPAVVLLGFVLGSAAAITFALAGTAIVFLVLRGEHPRLDAEIGELLFNVALFGVLTVAAGASFVGEIRQRHWRRASLAALAAVLAAIAAYHLVR
jgi:hypothetical protein